MRVKKLILSQVEKTCGVGHWSANYCNLFGVMRKAKLIKPVINIGARKLEENPYRMGQRIALRSQDMTAARLTFLMLRAQKLLLPDYDFYYRCERKVGQISLQ